MTSKRDTEKPCLCDAAEMWGCTYSDHSESEDALPCICLCHHKDESSTEGQK